MRRLSALSTYRVPLAITEEFVAILRRAVLYLRRQISAAGSRVVVRDACPGVSFPNNTSTARLTAPTISRTLTALGLYQFTRLSDRRTT
jgi:hypothetical protein